MRIGLRRTLVVAAALAALPLSAGAFSLNGLLSSKGLGGPTVRWLTPAEGGKLGGDVKGPPLCEVEGTRIVRVMFYVNDVWTNTDGNLENGLGCWVDTTKYANGTYRFKAVAYDQQGRTATAERSVVIENAAAAPAPTPQAPAPATISSADLLQWASGDQSFANQGGYTAQVLGTYTSAKSIPESGIHGTTLANGETLRMGKQTDPTNGARKALAFQIAYSDPNTSGSKRSELSFTPVIEMEKVYWIALRAFVRDWGSENTAGLFGTQVHSGDNSRGLSPSFGIYIVNGRNLQVQTRYSTSTSPAQSNSITVRHGEHPIPFGRWVDFVFKFRHSLSGNGFLQAWMDGTQIVDYRGHLGFNTPGYRDYAKFGVYKWVAFNTPRHVMLHNPTVVLDPTGSKYTAAALRAHVQ